MSGYFTECPVCNIKVSGSIYSYWCSGKNVLGKTRPHYFFTKNYWSNREAYDILLGNCRIHYSQPMNDETSFEDFEELPFSKARRSEIIEPTPLLIVIRNDGNVFLRLEEKLSREEIISIIDKCNIMEALY